LTDLREDEHGRQQDSAFASRPEGLVIMFARVAVWEPMPDDDRQWVIDAVKSVPGVVGSYHLVDPATGNGLSVAFFEDDVDAAAVKGALARRAEAIGWNSVPRPAPKSETIYQVIRWG
jgi:hypothetical protein